MFEQILVPNALTRTGLGIMVRQHESDSYCVFFVLCPECCHKDSTLCYQNSRGPEIVCESCGKTFTSFPGIPESNLAHSGPWFQVMQYRNLEEINKDALAGWIERWTGLTGVGVQV